MLVLMIFFVFEGSSGETLKIVIDGTTVYVGSVENLTKVILDERTPKDCLPKILEDSLREFSSKLEKMDRGRKRVRERSLSDVDRFGAGDGDVGTPAKVYVRRSNISVGSMPGTSGIQSQVGQSRPILGVRPENISAARSVSIRPEVCIVEKVKLCFLFFY